MRYALRVLARQPSFSAVTVLSLGLGIGATAAIFTLIDRVLWRQLPVRAPEQLVNFVGGSGSYFALQQYQARSQDMLQGVLATTGDMERDLSTGGEATPGHVELVTGNYFELLGVRPWIGRTIVPEDDRRSQTSAVAVLNYAYWQRAWGGNSAALGSTLYVGKAAFTVVGVTPPEFFGVTVGELPDVWLPLSTLPQVIPGNQWLDRPNTNFLGLMGRLRPGITAERAAAALTPLTVEIDLQRGGPDLPAWIRQKIEASQLKLNPAAQGFSWLQRRFSKPLNVLFAMVSIVLLLVCVNVMGLQIARVDERRREVNVRLAIGAGRWRIVRQLLTENVILAAAGGLVGLAICRPAVGRGDVVS